MPYGHGKSIDAIVPDIRSLNSQNHWCDFIPIVRFDKVNGGKKMLKNEIECLETNVNKKATDKCKALIII